MTKKEIGSAWKGMTGNMKSSFEKPAPNCCIAYSKKEFSGKKSEPICYTKNGASVIMTIPFDLKSIDCGENTFATYARSMKEGE